MSSPVETQQNGDGLSRQNPQRLAEIEMWRGDLRVLLRILQDSRTPRYASGLMFGVLLWGVLPIDPLPDAIPLGGIVDDAGVFLIVRAGVYRLIPDEIVDFHTEVVAEKSNIRFGPTRAVASIIVLQIVVIIAVLGGMTSIFF